MLSQEFSELFFKKEKIDYVLVNLKDDTMLKDLHYIMLCILFK